MLPFWNVAGRARLPNSLWNSDYPAIRVSSQKHQLQWMLDKVRRLSVAQREGWAALSPRL
jgi:hypothetical protein